VIDRLLRSRDVAELLDVSVETVLRWHRSGKLPGGRRLGSNVLRFDRNELDVWLEGTRVEVCLTGISSRDIIPELQPGNGGGDEATNVGARSTHG
jgi:excisionase family DNA binding protein